jgi:hypothetical protein
MASVGDSFTRLTVSEAEAERARQLSPIYESRTLDGAEFIFRDADAATLAGLGQTSRPNLAELFVAVIGADR